MKKASLKTTTAVDAPNQGTANRRVSRTSTKEGGKPFDSSEFQIKASTEQGVGTANSRYASSTPNGEQPIGLAQPLRTNSPMRDDISSIGTGVLTKSTPLRKRKG